MNLRPSCLLLALLAPLPAARGQMPLPVPRPGPAPLLYVRFSGPPGMRATFYQGQPRGRTFPAPVVVGLRPGYLYRVQLTDLTDFPGVSLYPTLEVLGPLGQLPKSNVAAFPAPVVLTAQDVESALRGALVTKVVYLEDPERAPPQGAPPGEVVETDQPPGRDLMAEARALGRPVLVLRFGERTLTADELARQTVPGTILFPGMKVLSAPRLPPCLPCSKFPFFDPILGPRPGPECIHDGGDAGLPAGIGPDGQLHGLDPEDTVAEYTDSHGRRHVACSNRVCLCVPRFAVLRSLLPLGGVGGLVEVNQTQGVRLQEQLRLRLPSGQATLYEQARGAAGRLRPSVNVNTQWTGELLKVQALSALNMEVGPLELIGTVRFQQLTEVERTRLVRQIEFARQLSMAEGVGRLREVVGTAVVGRVEGGPQIVTGTLETGSLTFCCHEAPCALEKPLVLVKCADRTSAHPGDVVTFTLRYVNVGGRPITDVAVSDSLAGRLEYVPGSAQSDRDAVFTVQENEAGSVVLRWEVGGRLLPGQGGTVRFQVRVR